MGSENKESRISFLKRITALYNDKFIDAQEWITSVLGKEYLNTYSDEYIRRASTVFKIFLDKSEDEDLEALGESELIDEIKKAQEELIKERKKLQAVNSELQATYRNQSRSELFDERILEAIEKLEPVKIKNFNYTSKGDVSGLLAISDFHCGSDYVVYSPCVGGVQEIMNQYNFEIMKNRLWSLLSQIENDDMVFSELYIGLLGDFFENILRLSSLAKIKEPVVDTVIKFSEFMCVWLTEVYNRLQVPIKVITVGGNHDQIAFLQSGGGRMEEENLAKIVVKFMEIRFQNHQGIKINPYSDVCIETIQGTNVMFNHGEDKDLKTTIEYFSNAAQIDCDEVIAGHLHRPETKSIGIADVGDRTITRVGSLCGIDGFSKKIRASARPSAYMAMYTQEGKSWSKNYYLG